MKRIEERPQGLLLLYRILAALVCVMAFILLSGTIYGLVRKASGKTRPVSPAQGTQASGGESIFNGIGTLRISTKDDDPETVILSIAFPYDKSDTAFTEELVSRIQDFKTAAAEYLGSFTSDELHQLDTQTINSELLTRYNAILHLGEIRELYFLDYIWL
jgi:flagellar basal body-associated protein FliL